MTAEPCNAMGRFKGTAEWDGNVPRERIKESGYEDLKALFKCTRSVGYTIEHCYGPNPHPRDMRKRAHYPLQARGSVGDYSHQHGELVDRQKASYESDANAAENHSSAWVEAHFDRRFNATL